MFRGDEGVFGIPRAGAVPKLKKGATVGVEELPPNNHEKNNSNATSELSPCNRRFVKPLISSHLILTAAQAAVAGIILPSQTSEPPSSLAAVIAVTPFPVFLLPRLPR